MELKMNVRQFMKFIPFMKILWPWEIFSQYMQLVSGTFLKIETHREDVLHFLMKDMRFREDVLHLNEGHEI